MQPLMQKKREASCLVPYRKRDDSFEFYLQKRDKDAHAAGDMLGLFGGGIEAGESVEEALAREMREELVYVPVAATYWSRFEHATGVNHVFVEPVDGDFESRVDVHEGQYGIFLTYEEMLARPDVLNITRLVIFQLDTYLSSTV